MIKSFIETQFPVSKVSKESYKERKANYSQTLTGLGKWWGRKPLILVRAAIIGLLMPATTDPVKDREIFLKILTMDDEGLLKRKNKNIPLKEIYKRLTAKELNKWFSSESTEVKPKWKKGIKPEEKKEIQRVVFHNFSYDEKLKYCCRPEHIEGPSESAWKEINSHLGTTANNLEEIICQLGEREFGNVPRVGDAFCGGGSVPFEAARLGCSAYGSDLNPVAALLTWAGINFIGGGKYADGLVHKARHEIYREVDREITKWGIEHNEEGERADAYLYCSEVICPECGWKIPLAPSWVIGEKTRCIAKLEPDSENKSFRIHIQSEVSTKEMKAAKEAGTVKNNSLSCPNCDRSTPITMLRNDRCTSEGIEYGLRMWENSDIVPRSSDVFQERLYCIRWVDTYADGDGRKETIRYYSEPDDDDFKREEQVLYLLSKRISNWGKKGYIPTRPIQPGAKTDEPIRTRGWTYWHHLFNPRQLLTNGLFFESIMSNSSIDDNTKVVLLLMACRCCDYNAKLSRWHSHGANEKSEQVFSNQALNTLLNYGARTVYSLRSVFKANWPYFELEKETKVEPMDARNVTTKCNLWITDPPYADAINYHELSEFFLAWYEKHIVKMFPQWYADSKRALAITGTDASFRKNMVDCYRNLKENMSDNGAQIVMFTHQDASVWADLALILWAAGLRVSAAWCIATETDTAFRSGNYVQGTVLLVLRKQMSDETAFFDELYPEVEEEVKHQLNEMLELDDQEEPNFGDTDYQLAAYAAALRVLTRYHKIEDMDITHELSRIRQPGEQSSVVNIINEAVKIACDHLVPQGLDSFTWKSLAPEERFYLKGLEIESHGEYRAGAYQELARGFGLREYRSMLAGSKANQTRLKTASQFGARILGDSGFGASLVRHVLFAIRESVRTGEIVNGRNWFHNELKQEYWNQRKTVVKLLNYLASLGQNKNMPHWKDDADAARLLAGAVENDHV